MVYALVINGNIQAVGINEKRLTKRGDEEGVSYSVVPLSCFYEIV